VGSSISLDNVLKSPALTLETFGEAETRELAERVGGQLRNGDWICLIGDLGAGKTTFVRGLGDALHCQDPVRSPTFTLVQTYKTRTGPIKRLNHVDLYRLEPKDVASLEWDGLLDERGVTVVEWAEKARPFWAADGCAVRIRHEGLDRRQFEFFPLGQRWPDLIKRLKA
jgi:tRNA threonylcarbamoyladenosine biosynthesis protein TsaE